VRPAERNSTASDAVSKTIATAVRRVIADCRAMEMDEPRSAIAARTAEGAEAGYCKPEEDAEKKHDEYQLEEREGGAAHPGMEARRRPNA